MNRKQLTILIVLVAIIGGAGFVFFKRQSNAFLPSGQRLGEKLFPTFPINEITQIEIKQSAGEVNLVKTNDLWTVKERNNYPANFSLISGLLVKASGLKIGQSEEIGASQFGRMELIEPGKGSPAGTLVQFKESSGKTVQSAILGKKNFRKPSKPSQFGDEGFPDGRYILLPTDPKNVYLVSDSLSDVEPKPENWLNKDFFKIEKVKTISLVSTNTTNSWKLSRTNETSGWELADLKTGEEFNTNKASSVASSFASPNFTDVIVNEAPHQTGLDKPTTAKFETFDGLTYILDIGTNSGENYSLTMKVSAELPKERVAGKDEKPEDKTKLDKEFSAKDKSLQEKLQNEKQFEKWTYSVPKFTIDPLLRDRAQLMVEKAPAKKQILDPAEPDAN